MREGSFFDRPAPCALGCYRGSKRPRGWVNIDEKVRETMENKYDFDDKDVTLICSKAEQALSLHPRSRKPQKFQHTGKTFYASFTGLRVLVKDEDGSPVCYKHI